MSNIYKTIDDVADHLDLTRPIKDDRFWGCEFAFKGRHYRLDSSGMMSGPGIDADPKDGLYVLAEVLWREDDCSYANLGQYHSFTEAMARGNIEGLSLGLVLIDPACEVTDLDGHVFRVLTEDQVRRGEW